jgi:hypothetical protein
MGAETMSKMSQLTGDSHGLEVRWCGIIHGTLSSDIGLDILAAKNNVTFVNTEKEKKNCKMENIFRVSFGRQYIYISFGEIVWLKK